MGSEGVWGQIYVLQNSQDPTDNNYYVGGTTEKCLRQRMKRHRYECTHPNRHHYSYKVYEHIRSTGGMEKWEIVQLEAGVFASMFELREREQMWIDQLRPTLNTMEAVRPAKRIIF